MNQVVFAQNKIVINTDKTSLVLQANIRGKLYQLYFGEKLSPESVQQLSNREGMESYVSGGMNDLFEPAVSVIHPDGNMSLDLRFMQSNTVSNAGFTQTDIELRDTVYSVKVVLHFAAYTHENIIKQWVDIYNNEKQSIRLGNYASSMLRLNAEQYFLTQFYGDWAKEMRKEESKLTSGIKILDSKLGTRADMYQSPVFALGIDAPANENQGQVILGTLGWTGNFRFLFDVDEQNKLRIISGINPYNSQYELSPGKVFTTPDFIFTYSANGLGQASRNLHQWARNYGILDGNGTRYTLLNNWETTFFNFDETKLLGLFKNAKDLGVDLFLLDDGWFGNKYPRRSDNAGLGDWDANKKILPNGIETLVKGAEKEDMKFGIWIEPEMVNPKSELYEKHPDWILKLPNREENYFRNQLVLDLTNPEVQKFVYGIVDDLLTKNPGIAYIKWDCNRMMTNAYSPFLKEKQSHLYIDYVKAFYAVMEKLRAKYPRLPIMLCSGGGGRTDYGALKYFTEFWASDNTDAVERIFIQWGYSYFFPSLSVAAHITSWGQESLKFKTDVAMMGRMGYDIDVTHLSDNDLAFSKAAVQNYKRLSELIYKGNLYRLIAPYNNERASLMYVNGEQSHALLFTFTMHPRFGTEWTPVKLEGLQKEKLYKVEETNLYPGTRPSLKENGKTFSGEYLMNVGLYASSSAPLTSGVIEITAVPK
ncbi:MAG: alpha-galactosidase [Chitinophagaceae bacterium]|nr:alpha-galactosidase [Chitinophagaceae bacterium]